MTRHRGISQAGRRPCALASRQFHAPLSCSGRQQLPARPAPLFISHETTARIQSHFHQVRSGRARHRSGLREQARPAEQARRRARLGAGRRTSRVSFLFHRDEFRCADRFHRFWRTTLFVFRHYAASGTTRKSITSTASPLDHSRLRTDSPRRPWRPLFQHHTTCRLPGTRCWPPMARRVRSMHLC